MTESTEARLSRIFRRILLASLGAPPLAFFACSDDRPEKIESVIATGGVSGKDAAFDACAPTVLDVLVTSVEGSAVCYAFHQHECGIPEGVVQADANCSFTLNDCQKLCPLSGAYVCNAIGNSCDDAGQVDYDGAFHVACEFCPSNIGRRPEGLLLASGARGADALGDHFARMSELEAASVTAFEHLVMELRGHGAPRSLIRKASRARRDEIRHARVTRRLALRFGASPVEPTVAPACARPLEALATENAVEGCVRETFGALIAHFQAKNAQDPRIARVLAGIAADETRHAALGWEVAAWAESRLSPAARTRVRRALRAATQTLAVEIAPPPPSLATQAGLPSAGVQRGLLGALDASLWFA